MGHFSKPGDANLSRSFTKEMEEMFDESKFKKAKITLLPD